MNIDIDAIRERSKHLRDVVLASGPNIADDIDALLAALSTAEARATALEKERDEAWRSTAYAEVQAAQRERDSWKACATAAEGALERDRTLIAMHARKVRLAFDGRTWVMEGRGSYPYDDDRYRDEVRHLYDEAEPHLDALQRVGGDLRNCPTTQEAVDTARAALAPPDAARAAPAKWKVVTVDGINHEIHSVEACADHDDGLPPCAYVLCDRLPKAEADSIAAELNRSGADPRAMHSANATPPDAARGEASNRG